MDINSTELIGWIGVIVIAALGLFFSENIKNIVQHYFSNRSKNQINGIFYAFFVGGIALFLAIAYVGGFQKKTDIIDNQPQTQKTKESDYVEAGKEIYDIANEAYVKKKHKDSVLIANREKIWAYQIGTPKKLDAAWDLYEKVKHLDGICFFKSARKEYIVIKYDGKSSEEEIQNSLATLESSIENLGENVHIIDLMSFCSKKEKVVEQKKLRNKKKDFEVRLYECEK